MEVKKTNLQVRHTDQSREGIFIQNCNDSNNFKRGEALHGVDEVAKHQLLDKIAGVREEILAKRREGNPTTPEHVSTPAPRSRSHSLLSNSSELSNVSYGSNTTSSGNRSSAAIVGLDLLDPMYQSMSSAQKLRHTQRLIEQLQANNQNSSYLADTPSEFNASNGNQSSVARISNDVSVMSQHMKEVAPPFLQESASSSAFLQAQYPYTTEFQQDGVEERPSVQKTRSILEQLRDTGFGYEDTPGNIVQSQSLQPQTPTTATSIRTASAVKPSERMALDKREDHDSRLLSVVYQQESLKIELEKQSVSVDVLETKLVEISEALRLLQEQETNRPSDNVAESMYKLFHGIANHVKEYSLVDYQPLEDVSDLSNEKLLESSEYLIARIIAPSIDNLIDAANSANKTAAREADATEDDREITTQSSESAIHNDMQRVLAMLSTLTSEQHTQNLSYIKELTESTHSELSTARQQIGRLTTELASVSNTAAQNNDYKERYYETSNTLKELETKYSALSEQLETARSEAIQVNEYKETIREQEQKIAELQQRCDSMCESHANELRELESNSHEPVHRDADDHENRDMLKEILSILQSMQTNDKYDARDKLESVCSMLAELSGILNSVHENQYPKSSQQASLDLLNEIRDTQSKALSDIQRLSENALEKEYRKALEAIAERTGTVEQHVMKLYSDRAVELDARQQEKHEKEVRQLREEFNTAQRAMIIANSREKIEALQASLQRSSDDEQKAGLSALQDEINKLLLVLEQKQSPAETTEGGPQPTQQEQEQMNKSEVAPADFEPEQPPKTDMVPKDAAAVEPQPEEEQGAAQAPNENTD